MLDLAFNLLNLNRLESFILDEDERAMHSFSKNSFKKEGLLYEYTYLNGEYKNVLVLSILKSEYEEFMR
jgi:RimJ/RimL family protein N-acetyltransferase